MSLFIECKPDETLAHVLGVPRKEIQHALGRASVCAQLARRAGVTGMVDEDPGSAEPPYLKSLTKLSWEHGIRVFSDPQRNNRIIMLSPRLEEWLVQSAKRAGLKLTDFGFASDNGIQLHGEINQRLGSLEKLVKALLSVQSPQLLRLQTWLTQP